MKLFIGLFFSIFLIGEASAAKDIVNKCFGRQEQLNLKLHYNTETQKYILVGEINIQGTEGRYKFRPSGNFTDEPREKETAFFELILYDKEEEGREPSIDVEINETIVIKPGQNEVAIFVMSTYGYAYDISCYIPNSVSEADLAM